jgi:predicted transcriptional regulator of viral defense system
MKEQNQTKKEILKQINRAGLLRSNELLGASGRMYLKRLSDAGKIRRVARGVYAPKLTKASELLNFAIASAKIPKAVICLVSALHFHNLTTQIPWEVWLAIPRNSRKPHIDELSTRFAWYSSEMLRVGVITVTVDGIAVNITSPARTVVDCFKYRYKVGLDVCLEALREGWRRKTFTIDELWKYAKICRVTTIIRPYIESLT